MASSRRAGEVPLPGGVAEQRDTRTGEGESIRARGQSVERRDAGGGEKLLGHEGGDELHLRYPDGQELRFDSVWEPGPAGHVVEFVNPWLGLQMQPFVVGQQLHYRGVRFVARVGRRTLHIPEWLALGHTTIVERAIDEHHFAMDFRLLHPVFGQVFRYSGTFRANASANTGIAAS